jgi:hypothetical protein
VSYVHTLPIVYVCEKSSTSLCINAPTDIENKFSTLAAVLVVTTDSRIFSLQFRGLSRSLLQWLPHVPLHVRLLLSPPLLIVPF